MEFRWEWGQLKDPKTGILGLSYRGFFVKSQGLQRCKVGKFGLCYVGFAHPGAGSVCGGHVGVGPLVDRSRSRTNY